VRGDRLLRLAGFVHIMARNDIVKMMMSATKVIVRNLRFSMYIFSTKNYSMKIFPLLVNINLVTLFGKD